MRFGVSTQLYHGQRLCRAHLDEVASFGFDAIEIVATRSHVDYHDERALDEVAHWLSAAGLRLHSIHAPITEAVADGRWTAPFSTASPDETVRRRAVDEARLALGLARRVPVEVLVVHLGLPDSWLSSPDGNCRHAARRSVEEIAEAAGAAGVRVALENIPSALSTPESIVSLIEDDLARPDVGACLDFGHANLMGGVAEAVEALSGRLIATHVHDNHGARDEHLPPFDGTIAWHAALLALRKAGFDGTLMVEVAPNGSAAAAVLERARDACARLDEETRSWS